MGLLGLLCFLILFLQSGQHLLRRAEHLTHAVADQQQLVRGADDARAMRDQHDRLAAAAHVVNCHYQCLFADIVQVGIRLIKNHEGRVAIHRTRQANALLLSAGQAAAAITEDRVIAFREMQDQFMHAGALGSHDDFFGIDLAKARDVFTDSAAKQFNILRQVTDVRSELVFIPCVNVGAIEAHLADRCRPDADEQARQR